MEYHILYFVTLNQYAKTFEQAERLWEMSHDARSDGNTEGQRWLVNLLKKSRDTAPRHLRDHYDEAIRQAEYLAAVMAGPTIFRPTIDG